ISRTRVPLFDPASATAGAGPTPNFASGVTELRESDRRRLRLVCRAGLHFEPPRQSFVAPSDSVHHLSSVRVVEALGSGQDLFGALSRVSDERLEHRFRGLGLGFGKE